MADKKALFAGRSGDRSSRKKSGLNSANSTPTSPPPQPTRARQSPPSYARGAGARGVAATEERRVAQLKEAEENRKAANKCLQKTMTRWNPNYFSAAPLFEKAAECYRAAGKEEDAIAMFMTAGECQSHESVEAHASAARDFREAALITERQDSKDEASALYMRCAEAWVQADEAGRAAEYLARSAKLIEDTDEEVATERYLKTAKVMIPDGSDETVNFLKVVGSGDNLVQAIRFLASTKQLDECMEVVDRYCIMLRAESIDHSLARMYLTYCVLALAQGDYVKAETAFRNVHLQSTPYLRTEECRLEEDLVTAFREFKPDLLQKAQGDRYLRRLEPSIAHLAKTLRIPGDESIFEDASQGNMSAQPCPAGTIGDVKARVGALKAKHGASASPPVTTCNPSNLSHQWTPTSLPPVVENSASYAAEELGDTSLGDGGMADKAKADLFGGMSAAVPAARKEVGNFSAITASPSGIPEGEEQAEPVNDAIIDLDLSDLEASLAQVEGAGEGNDLDAIIEAAKKEAESLQVEGQTVGPEDVDEDEDDIDLT